MQKPRKRPRLLEWCICLAVSLAITSFAFFANKGAMAGEKELFKRLHDAFFLTGILFLGVAGLRLISQTGFFSGLSYILYSAGKTLFPYAGGKRESYARFSQKHTQKDGEDKLFHVKSVALTGGLSVMLGMIFLALWAIYL